MKFNAGDMIDTTVGLLSVQCPIAFNENNHSKYKVVGGKTLYWTQDMSGTDQFYWDHELEKLLTDDERAIQAIEVEQDLF